MRLTRLLQEEMQELTNVPLAAIAQGRHANLNDVETIVEILAERPGVNLCPQIPVGGSD